MEEFLLWRKCVRCKRWFRKDRKDFWHRSIGVGKNRLEIGWLCNPCYTVLNRKLKMLIKLKRKGGSW
ncbi:MAG TPA: hypothetical protein ENG66_07405 [Thermococcus sp.]|nr:hypothetical protein [Thermococcus sp.]